MSPEQIVKAVSRALAARDDVDLGVVFGSTARGDARPDSDVDVAVLGRDVDVLGVSAALARDLGLDVHVVRLEEAGIPLLESILDDGLVAYERRHGVAATWRSHTLTDLELDRPWYALQRDAWLRRVAEKGL